MFVKVIGDREIFGVIQSTVSTPGLAMKSLFSTQTNHFYPSI